MLEQRIQQVQQRCQELIEQANRTWQMTLPPIKISFELRGRVAGWAMRSGTRWEMRFNSVMMQNEAWDHIITDTVPHELAHIVCMFRQWDRGHGPRWRSVCRALGGSGETYHREKVVYAKGETYAYISTTGHEVRLSEKRHHRVQNGGTYMFRGMGSINRQCRWSRVGQPTVQPTVQPAVQPTVQPAVPVNRVPQPLTVDTAGTSKAERVRAIIRRVRAEGGGPIEAQRAAVELLGLTPGYARSCVAFNWSRA